MKMIAGALCLGRLEQVPDPAGAHAHDELDELRGRHEVEGHVGLAGHGPGEQGLAGPGRPGQQHPPGHHGPQPPVAVGVLEEVDDLGHLVLDLVDAGHVGEGGAPAGLGLVAAGPGAAKAAEGARAPAPPAARRASSTNRPTSSRVGPNPSSTRSSSDGPGGGSAATSTFFSVSSSHRLSSAANSGRRVLNRVTSWVLVVHGNPDRVLELAVDGVLDPGDSGDVARLHLGAEQRVGHLGAFGGPHQQRRQHPVQHQQPQQHHPEPRPEQPRPLWPLAAVPPGALHPPRHPVATLGRRRGPGVPRSRRWACRPSPPAGCRPSPTSSSRKPRGSPRIPKGYRPHRARRRCGLRFSIRRRVLWSSARTTVVTGFCFQVGGAILAGACRWPTRRDVGCEDTEVWFAGGPARPGGSAAAGTVVGGRVGRAGRRVAAGRGHRPARRHLGRGHRRRPRRHLLRRRPVRRRHLPRQHPPRHRRAVHRRPRRPPWPWAWPPTSPRPAVRRRWLHRAGLRLRPPHRRHRGQLPVRRPRRPRSSTM